MKWKLQSGPEGATWIIEASGVIAKETHIKAQLQQSEGVHELTVSQIGDGRSFLVGTQIVRVQSPITKGKKGNVRLRTGSHGVARSCKLEIIRPVEPKVTQASLGGGPLKSPMTGKILAIPVADGAEIKEGDVLTVIEAMKMENRILAECDGRVQGVAKLAGQNVTVGELILTVVPKTP